MPSMLRFTDVTKTYGKTTAVDGLSLSINPGEIFGLLGPNGAGKSTSVGLAVGLFAPNKGQVTIGDLGEPTDPNVRSRLGVATQALALYEDLTGRENLNFFGGLYGLRRSDLTKQVAWALDFVGLSDRADDRVSVYSGGMKRRINMASALLHKPDLLLLDEPTVGVDPQSRNLIMERIDQWRDEGRTVIYTTHYMEEAQRLCDRVGIIDHGKLLALGTVDELIAQHGGSLRASAETDDGTVQIEADSVMQAFDKLRELPGIHSFSSEKPTLETVFLNLTGRRLRD